MGNKGQTIEDFFQENQAEFARYLNRFAADRILLSRVTACVVAALLLFSLLNGMKYGWLVGMGYMPAILAFIAFKVLFELGVPIKPHAILWIDLLMGLMLLGFNFILWRIVADQKAAQISSNGSLTIIAVSFTFMAMNHSQMRMLLQTLLCFAGEVLFLYALQSDLVALFKMEIIFGLTLSLIVGYLKFEVFKLYFYHIETGSASLMHAYSQLQKLVFPHQLDLMKVGFSLEESMPVGSGEAAVLCYDIQRSSQIPQETLNRFIQQIMERCHDIFSAGYSHNPLQVTAFKLKEMGDGFICTIGFPFAQPGPLSVYDTALQVALDCQRVTAEVREAMNLDIGYCSIGIASGTLHSYYTRVGIKVYDVFGTAMVMARRYESFRKHYLAVADIPDGDMITVEAGTFEACSKVPSELFLRLELEKLGLRIRDALEVQHVYVVNFPPARAAQFLKAS